MTDNAPVPPPLTRVAIIETSLRGFVYGIIGFLPFIGVIPGILAIRCHGNIKTRYGSGWNPAINYLRCGVVLAILGLLGTGLILFSAVATLAVYGF